jgi:cob(I)alamin adenosyltransferase
MKIYTRTGDAGKTSLYSGQRIAKEGLRVEAYGTLDELSAALGMARSLCQQQNVVKAILAIQQFLIRLMGEIATLGHYDQAVTAADIQHIEQQIDRFSQALAPLNSFLLSGESPGSAALHLSRTIARRAERLLWRLARAEKVSEKVLIWVNRLSDYCFVLARSEAEIPNEL